jgi:aquaporin Z
MDQNVRSYVTELVGTFAVVFVSASTVCALHLGAPPPAGFGITAAEAAATGLALAAALAVALPHTTGYFNPAVTIMLWVFRRLDGVQTAVFLFVQLLGAAVAGGLVRLVYMGSDIALTAARMGTPHLHLRAFSVQGLTPSLLVSGIALEAVLTFVLTVVIFGTLIDPRAPRLLGRACAWLSPLWVGLARCAITFAGFTMTGAAANPARWFGTVIWENSVDVLGTTSPYADNMVYWIGPIVGALIAGSLYTALVLPAEEPPAAAPPATTAKPTAGAGTLFRSKK